MYSKFNMGQAFVVGMATSTAVFALLKGNPSIAALAAIMGILVAILDC